MAKLSAPRTGKREVQVKVGAANQSASDQLQNNASIDATTRHAMIAEAAYFRAERRGFAPGFELEDWLQSDVEMNALEKTVQTSTELH
ncbi:MAG TPA: DUF2934 domain-containing protein [Steroidobacteraceae bacterium]|nr:DUF2934 domain-containing protein [Steroidobacteraceae bacterium]